MEGTGAGVVVVVDEGGVGCVSTGAGVDGCAGGGVVSVTGASLFGLEVDSVEGAVDSTATLSRNHAAVKPSLPSIVRTRTH